MVTYKPTNKLKSLSGCWIISTITCQNYKNQVPKSLKIECLKVKFPAFLHSKEFKNRVDSFLIATRNSTMEKVNLERESSYLYETYLLLTKLMSHQGTNFDKNTISKLLRIRGKYILIRASNYVGNVNVDTILNTYTDF